MLETRQAPLTTRLGRHLDPLPGRVDESVTRRCREGQYQRRITKGTGKDGPKPTERDAAAKVEREIGDRAA